MMTPSEAMDFIINGGKPGIATLSPGPLRVKIGNNDIKALKLIQSLKEQYPEATVNELLDVLDEARWWMIFWSATALADKADYGNGDGQND